DEIVALDARGDDRLAYGLEIRVALGALARRHHDRRRLDAAGLENVRDAGKMRFRNVLVGEDGDARPRPQRLDALAERPDGVAANDDVIGAVAERDRHDGLCRLTQ